MLSSVSCGVLFVCVDGEEGDCGFGWCHCKSVSVELSL